ncbi:MAG TPA: serine/threonine-protein kinase [Gemmatimonadales bacterium]|nr:serine/threonine-protein kinase [Gemmatimonadales bacterium]
MSADPLETLRAALSDRYRVDRLLGSGGMATVYLAHDLKHDRPVAIKVLRPGLAAALGPERFLREIQIAARLNHPHILALHDSGEFEGLLYYVMPYVEGESLQDRIAREKQLPVADAIRLTREVASALAYAHGLGFIHRDIKPGNILISNGYALVADFGLARALTQARGTDSITHAGITIGTPTYMSPEQGSDDAVIDGRSDIYALGCVVYEMLVGDPPFSGSTPGAVLARHAAGRVMPIRAIRPAVPVAAERAVLRALEKMPADRYQTAGEFSEALRAAGEGVRREGLPRWATWTAMGAAAAGIGLAVWSAVRPGGLGGRGDLDTSRYAILPFEGSSQGPLATIGIRLHEALSRWDSVDVTDPSRVNAALGGPRTAAPDPEGAQRIARRLRVGRYVRGQVLPAGDSVQVIASLHETRTAAVVARGRVRLAASASGVDSAMGDLAELLLFRGRLPRGPGESRPQSRSLAAVHAFIEGRELVKEWDLSSADSAFARALALDSQYAEAALWLAQIRAWQGIPPRIWGLQAEQAFAAAGRLGPRDAAVAGALSALGRRDYLAACPRWTNLTAEWPHEFIVWYGAATCLTLDDAVRRDPRSPSRWSFRSSYHQAQTGWLRAFELQPTIIRDFLPGGRRPGQALPLWTATNRIRPGRSVAPDRESFFAFPSWQGDTIAFVPYRTEEFHAGRGIVAAPSTSEAVRHQRRTLYDLASAWRSADPANLSAREVVATSLWLQGNLTAKDSLHVARGLARSAADRVRLGLTEALMLALQEISNEENLKTVRRLMDSLLVRGPLPARMDAWEMATMAALTGRAREAARLARMPGARTAWILPPGLASDAFAFLAYASLGGPRDSLLALEKSVEQGILSSIEARARTGSRLEWLARPVSLAHLEAPFSTLPSLAGLDDYLIDAEAAYHAGDTLTMRRKLREAASGRAWMQPSDHSFETLHPEASLLAAIGDVSGAIRLLDPTLQSLRSTSLDLYRNPVGAGMLVRAMALRAELAARSDDQATAARWARAVLVLWSDADDFLQPIVSRMEQLSRGNRA